MIIQFTTGHKMNPIFINDLHQYQFDTNGYLTTDLLTSHEICALKLIYKKHFDQKTFNQFTTTNVTFSKEKKFEIANEIDSIIVPKIQKILKDINIWPGAFLIKPPGENTEFEAHQDWTFVDEDKFVSGNVWIPLHDVDVHTGCLSVISSSHYPNIKTIRSQTIPDFFHSNRKLLTPYTKPLPIKAGQIVVFNHSLIHYSYPNLSSQNRVVVSNGFNSIGAPLLHYLKTNYCEVELYEMPNNFVFDYDNLETLKQKPILGKHLKTFKLAEKQLTDNEIIEMILKIKQS